MSFYGPIFGIFQMNQLLYEQDYQSNIVNSINCSTGPNDHLSSSSSPLLPSSSPPLLLHSVPIVSLQQLSKCLASVETLLSDIQRKTDVIEKNSSPCQQVKNQFEFQSDTVCYLYFYTSSSQMFL